MFQKALNKHIEEIHFAVKGSLDYMWEMCNTPNYIMTVL